MASDVATTVRSCDKRAKNLVLQKGKTNPMLLLPAARPLECIALDIHGNLTKTKSVFQYVVVIGERFQKLTHVVRQWISSVSIL